MAAYLDSRSIRRRLLIGRQLLLLSITFTLPIYAAGEELVVLDKENSQSTSEPTAPISVSNDSTDSSATDSTPNNDPTAIDGLERPALRTAPAPSHLMNTLHLYNN